MGVVGAPLPPGVPQVPPAEGARLVAEGACLLDVRGPSEWAAGHAGSAVHLPMADLTTRVGEIPTDRVVVAICRSGARSDRVALFLRGLGIDAVNLAGGMQAWSADGLDVVTDGGGVGRVA